VSGAALRLLEGAEQDRLAGEEEDRFAVLEWRGPVERRCTAKRKRRFRFVNRVVVLLRVEVVGVRRCGNRVTVGRQVLLRIRCEFGPGFQ
jgi:hypothetical protein